jgi:hypothetical protein
MQKAPNKSLQPTPFRGAAELERVRRALPLRLGSIL